MEKVQDNLDLCKSPPDRAPVLWGDAKSQVRALFRTQPVLPVLPGIHERSTHDDKRKHTTSPFAVLDMATGAVIGKCCGRHRAGEFLDFLRATERNVPGGSTHTALAARRLTSVQRAAG